MAAQTYTIADSGEETVYKWFVLRVTATAADTVTVAQLDDITLQYCINLSANTAVTNTDATNVITIGTGPAATDLLIFVYGYKAL